eukprot:1869566-Amphidinium_carterae.1
MTDLKATWHRCYAGVMEAKEYALYGFLLSARKTCCADSIVSSDITIHPNTGVQMLKQKAPRRADMNKNMLHLKARVGSFPCCKC